MHKETPTEGPEGGCPPSGYQHIPHAYVTFALGSALYRKLKTSEPFTLVTCSCQRKREADVDTKASII